MTSAHQAHAAAQGAQEAARGLFACCPLHAYPGARKAAGGASTARETAYQVLRLERKLTQQRIPTALAMRAEHTEIHHGKRLITPNQSLKPAARASNFFNPKGSMITTNSETPTPGTHGWSAACDPDRPGGCPFDTFSVGVFEWLPKASGAGVKRGPVKVRVKALSSARDAAYRIAERTAHELDAGTYQGPKTLRVGGV